MPTIRRLSLKENRRHDALAVNSLDPRDFAAEAFGTACSEAERAWISGFMRGGYFQ